MSKGIDVLAVMGDVASNILIPNGGAYADELCEARAAVADLIMEAEGLLHFLDGHPAYRGRGPISDQLLNFESGLTAAIARVQGGAA